MKNEKLNHLAVIMDGNRRWAKKHFFNVIDGHKKGSENIVNIIQSCYDNKIKYLSLFAFSTENWNRPKLEVNFLMLLLDKTLDTAKEEFLQNKIRFIHIGRKDRLSKSIIDKISLLEDITKSFNKLTIAIAIDYGGQDEIITAHAKATQSGLVLEKCMYSSELPDIDMLIRTGGEKRVSNFMLWKLAYAEIYFTDVLFPDFNKNQMSIAIEDFHSRKRRFGK